MGRVVFLVSADTALTQQLIGKLVVTGSRHQMPLAASVAQALKGFQSVAPTVILLDQSALQPSKREEAVKSLKSAVAMLMEWAPVVVVAAPERQAELAPLITTGIVDFVARLGNFLPVAVGFLERRVRLAEQAEWAASSRLTEAVDDFGEMLRHEVNNPLTGILGNAELLLAECRRKNGDRLPPAAVERLQTIAELAVRLRETIRRLSNDWSGRHDHGSI